MSVFSMLKRGRQAAKEHAAKEAERKKKEAEKLPYKHVPRHAASDALAGGPATWREVDRPRIMEQNRRRSMLTASGVNMSGTATPVHVGFLESTAPCPTCLTLLPMRARLFIRPERTATPVSSNLGGAATAARSCILQWMAVRCL